ncbi:MAG: tRNA (adenosine(37)-N6)-dimethylallyltransferase MiaA [Anaerolineae bacterium]|nr:tRNA (adenosine(37)-N6)-dimethylallyltransferase MiaA [Anaerolineae bacterium]
MPLSSPSRGPLVAIVGPTAAGKTALALDLSHHLDLEVVSADSRQIYRYMDIGTAKPSASEMRLVPHHLVDVVGPDETLTLAQYQELAYRVIDDVLARGRLPLLVGGTGLYVWSVLENWQIPRVSPQPDLRRRLEEEAARHGPEYLHRRLADVDPTAAAGIHPNNLRRIIRALEVFQQTGVPISRLQDRGEPRYRYQVLGVTAPRRELYRRADQRVDAMIERGLVEETRRLLEAGYSPQLPAMSGLGYRQVAEYLAGQYDLSEAIRRIKTCTHRFIRQQHTWFRLDDPRICWFEQPLDPQEVLSVVRLFLEDRGQY